MTKRVDGTATHVADVATGRRAPIVQMNHFVGAAEFEAGYMMLGSKTERMQRCCCVVLQVGRRKPVVPCWWSVLVCLQK